MKKTTPPPHNRRPTATIDLKAEEISADKPDTGDRARSGAADTPSPGSTAERLAGGTIPGAGTAGTDKTASEKDKAANDTDRSKSGGSRADPAKTGSSNPAGKPATTPARSGGFSLFGHLFAATTGAALGILGMSYANNQDLLPDGFNLSSSAYRAQIIALEDKISTLEARSSNSGIDSLGGRLNVLKERLDRNEAALGVVATDSSLADKVAALETTIANLEAAAKTGEGGQLAGLTAVTRELTRASEQTARLNSEFVKMRDEQSAFRNDLASVRSGQADFHLVAARLEDEIAKLKTNDAKLTVDIGRPPDVSAQIDPLADAVKTLRSDVNGLVDRESGSRAEGRNIALALSLGELKRAVNQGGSYRAELARVAPHAPRNLDLAPLQAHADNGLVTLKALKDQFASLSRTALAAETTAASGSLVDQLVANARSLVQVRPTGLVDGDTTSAILSRIEYRFDRGELADVLKESDSLKGEPRKVLQPWLERTKARFDADTLLVTLEDRIRNSLAGVSTE